MEIFYLNIDSKIRNNNIYKSSSYFKIDKDISFKNLKYIKLLSIDINNIYTINENEYNNFFTLYINNIEHNIQIKEGIYNITNLIETINFNLLNYNVVLEYDNILRKIKINNNSEDNIIINFDNNSDYKSLGYLLGFRKNEYIISENTISESIYNLDLNNYIFLRINDYGNLYIQPNNPTKVFTKILLNKNEILYNMYNFKKPENINRIEIELLDYKGNRKDIKDIDYSLVLEIGILECLHKNEYILTHNL
jgi:hypothetical protein